MGDLINGSHRPGEMFGFDLDQLHGDSLGVSELVTRKSRKTIPVVIKKEKKEKKRKLQLQVCI